MDPNNPYNLVGYMPAHLRTPTWRIWHTRIPVKMSIIQGMSEEEVRTFGLRVSGDEEWNKIAPNEMVHREMTVNEMIEKWKEGAEIYIIDRKDTIRIYEWIHAHLKMWMDYLKWEGNVHVAPFDDLMLMDQFCNKIHEYARFEFKAKETTSSFMDAIRSQNRIALSRERAAKKLPAARKNYTARELDKAYPKRVGLASVIKQYRREAG